MVCTPTSDLFFWGAMGKTTKSNGGGPLIENDLTPRYQPKTEATASNHIRDWRLFRGIKSQMELAERTVAFDPEKKGINRVTLARLENGVLRYNQGQIELIAKTLNVSPGELISVNPNDMGDIFAIYARMEGPARVKAGAAIRKALKQLA
jgi:transcriptional regulator with XRE-family HTH domain